MAESATPDTIPSASIDSPSKSNFLLGMNDWGFSTERLSDLAASLEQKELEYRQHKEALSLERQQLEHELGDRRSRITGQPRVFVGEKTRNQELIDKEERLRQFGFGNDIELLKFNGKISKLKREVIFEEEKRSDDSDLKAVVENFRGDKAVVLNRIVQPRNAPGDSFLEISGKDASLSEVEVGEDVTQEVWFHTTNHINKIIDNGGLATQAWIEKHDPDYYARLVENSTARGKEKVGSGSIDPNLSSPLNESDRDRVFFRANAIENYGSTIIAYSPEDILADTNLYFMPVGPRHMDERVVSDAVDLNSDSILPNGESDLCLPLEKAYVAVPKRDFRAVCVKFLEAGYSVDWIEEHVFSYRGHGEETYDGRRAACEEIKRRITKERQTRPEKNFAVIGNPMAISEARPNVCQLVTIAS